MSSKLDRVKDWGALANKCHYELCAVAKACSISERQLRRYFRKRYGITPKAWIDAQRVRVAAGHVLEGKAVKAIAIDLYFSQRSQFSKFFKRLKGTSPTNYTHVESAVL
jgi:AraC family transcriptional regulator, transcriptional activator for feuABC-ybbA operon